MNARQFRKVMMYVHLVTSLYIGYYIYSPVHEHPLLQILGRFLFFPIMIITGVVMWQWARIRKAQAQRERRNKQATAT